MTVHLFNHASDEPVALEHWQTSQGDNAGQDLAPLAFDLDGTLLSVDSATVMWKAATAQSWRHKMRLPPLVGLSRNAISLSIKTWCVDVVPDLDQALGHLTFNHGIVEHARAAGDAGRTLWLASGTLHPIALYFAERLHREHGLSFARVQGSVIPTNLIAPNKARWLGQHAPQGFDYVGDNPRQDTVVWARARHAYIVRA